MMELSPSQNHVFELVKLISAAYLKVRLHHLAKEKTQSLTSSYVRKTYSKLILFKAINKSRFRHAHAHTGTAGWRHRHSKFILCLRHLLIEMPNHSLLICLNQSDLILEVSKLHWCKTWFFVWHKLGHTDVEKTMAVIGTPLSTWQFCLLLSDGATYSYL